MYDVRDPSASVSESYAGQRPTLMTTLQLWSSFDLKQIGFPGDSQLIVGAQWNQTTYTGSMARGGYLFDLTINQFFYHKRLYVNYGFEYLQPSFYGTTVGANSTSSALGPSSNILTELGMSTWVGKPTPSLEIKWSSADLKAYNHFGLSRSWSSLGFIPDSQYNSSGLSVGSIPFASVLYIDEIGYKTNADASHGIFWARAGYIYNTSPYLDYSTGEMSKGNRGYYFAATKQVTGGDSAHVDNGLYLDLKVDGGSPSKNVFNRDIMGTIYDIGPFSSRPYDMVSLGYIKESVSHQALSYYRSQLLASGVPGSSTSSLSYAFHLLRGVYWTSELSYTNHPIIFGQSNHPGALIAYTSISLNI